MLKSIFRPMLFNFNLWLFQFKFSPQLGANRNRWNDFCLNSIFEWCFFVIIWLKSLKFFMYCNNHCFNPLVCYTMGFDKFFKWNTIDRMHFLFKQISKIENWQWIFKNMNFFSTVRYYSRNAHTDLTKFNELKFLKMLAHTFVQRS